MERFRNFHYNNINGNGGKDFRMYDNFRIPSDISIAGYRWDCENPTKVVCMVHGIGEHQGRYDEMARTFGAAGVAMVGMDHRGHGISGGTRGHTAPRESVLRDVDSLIKSAMSFYPGVPIVLYGHSMGGNIVLDYRLRGEMSGVPAAYIVTAPWVRLYRSVPRPALKALSEFAKRKPEFQISTRISPKFLGNPEKVGNYYKDPLVHSVITAQCASECFTIGNLLAENRLTGNNAGRGKPFLLMHGSDDKICSPEGSRMIAAYEENCRYIEWPGYYHEVHNGGPHATGELAVRKALEFILEV